MYLKLVHVANLMLENRYHIHKPMYLVREFFKLFCSLIFSVIFYCELIWTYRWNVHCHKRNVNSLCLYTDYILLLETKHCQFSPHVNVNTNRYGKLHIGIKQWLKYYQLFMCAQIDNGKFDL